MASYDKWESGPYECPPGELLDLPDPYFMIELLRRTPDPYAPDIEAERARKKGKFGSKWPLRLHPRREKAQ